MRCRSLVVPRQSDSIGMNAHAYTCSTSSSVRAADQQARGSARDSETEQGVRVVRGIAKAPCTGLPVCPRLQRTPFCAPGVSALRGRAHCTSCVLHTPTAPSKEGAGAGRAGGQVLQVSASGGFQSSPSEVLPGMAR
jgi:hypothetical protein